MTTSRKRPIRVGDTVRSISSGRTYTVDEILYPSSHIRNRVYGVTDTENGLPNAFRGDEITLTTLED